ncbi:lipopolysaccharide biosynthesis protein [Chitinophaga niabensis]|uniref:Membrane protein involved in the export of O-antigen and teichoic acid n=1 Tax=Chitinophaga niabensis TaxID=536979 RepID=A0A1N6EF16_9BACT|nr:lipopolysaccharide biosynthesis protein [Chitinophaga niabensis]SIN81551.1 Membrane protein involved in the export of O-antigen and teichoic acid [Chitinophaga niabensis]
MISRLLSVYRNKQVLSLFGNLVSAFFNLLSFMILVRILPTLDDFGQWVVFTGTYNILDQIRTGLLQSGIVKFYTGADIETSRRVAGAAWHLSLLITIGYVILSWVGYFAVSPFLGAPWPLFLAWLGILTLLSLPMNFASWVLQAENRFNEIVFIRISQNGSFVVLLALLWWFKQVSLANVLYAYSGSMAISSVYCLLKKWTGIRNIVYRTREQALELYRFGRLIIGSMVSSSLINNTNNFVILKMLGAANVALFSIPQKFIEVIEIILRSFVATAQPTLSAAANRGDKQAVAIAFCRYTGTVTLLIIPFIIGMLIFTEPLILILAKGNYLGATAVVRISLITAILWPLDRFNGVTLDMMGLAHVNFYKNILKLILNAIFAVVLVWIFPNIISVALAMLLHILFAIAYGYYVMKKHMSVHLKDLWHYGWIEFNILVKKALKLKHS